MRVRRLIIILFLSFLCLWIYILFSREETCPPSQGPVPLLMWTKFFKTEIDFTKWGIARNCSYKCQFTYDRTTLCYAPLILFHAEDLKNYGDQYTPYPVRKKDQIFALFTYESPTNQPYIADKLILSQFNLTFTYSRDSLVYDVYGPLHDIFTKDYCVPVSKRKKKAVWFLSDCKVNKARIEFAQELALYFDVDFFGDCFNNPKIPKNLHTSKEMKSFIGEYKFFFAFENSKCNDYVTEKYYRTLASCAIPVVLGAPNIEDYQPLPETIVVVGNKSPKEVADILVKIDNDDNLFLHYLRWKDTPRSELNPFFVHLYEKDISGGAYCELCRLVHEKPYPIQAKPVLC